MSRMSKQDKAEQAHAIDRLRSQLAPGTVVYTILRKVSRSGMMRHISLVVPEEGGGMWDITGQAALAMGTRWDRNTGGIKVSGAGMDMGFHLVYNLSRALYPEGHGCTGEKCPSNDHSNGDRDFTGGTVHRDGGYALRHRWL